MTPNRFNKNMSMFRAKHVHVFQKRVDVLPQMPRCFYGRPAMYDRVSSMI